MSSRSSSFTNGYKEQCKEQGYLRTKRDANPKMLISTNSTIILAVSLIFLSSWLTILHVESERVDHEYVEPLETDVIIPSFLVHLEDPNLGPSEVHEIAKRNGFINMGRIKRGTNGHDQENIYRFDHPKLKPAHPKRSIKHIKRLKRDLGVRHAFQMTGFQREKRGFKVFHRNPIPKVSMNNQQRLTRIPLTLNDQENKSKSHIKQNITDKDPTDPYFKYQWTLKNVGQNGGKPRLDLNVQEAWSKGYTGKNVTTAIMDDGVDYMHLDLKDNYNSEASYDFSSNDEFPYPRYTDDWFNSHGTRCAGEVSSKRDNDICGVGIAYDSKIAGIRMLDQPYMTDIIEANSMSHEPNLIDIYSASWGPTDNGKTVDGPRNATMHAIVRGVNEGRHGKGNIYVWASGDGGQDDDCNCDGYAASMWTISINSAINTGENAHYDESCSSTLASTFSNGAKDPHTGVATTDLYDRCTQTHSGTSAAAPEAAGVFALALEANRNLTWRDIQHLTVLTSKRKSLYDGTGRFDWKTNGVGLEYNHLFGFGVLDAGAMVDLAKDWRPLPSRYHCDAGVVSGAYPVPTNESLVLTIDTNACKGTSNEINYIEHVQAIITLNATRRGDLKLFLTSPSGTRSMILNRRPFDDDNKNGFTRWPFMTTQTWAENPRGKWTLEIKFYNATDPRDNPSLLVKQAIENIKLQESSYINTNSIDTNNDKHKKINLQKDNTLDPLEIQIPQQQGILKEWRLMIHGTSEEPYKDLKLKLDHSKLAIVKKAHGHRL